jgi:hypothetical protein
LWTINAHDTGKNDTLLVNNNENGLNHALLRDLNKGVRRFINQLQQLTNLTHGNFRNLFVVAVINHPIVQTDTLEEQELPKDILTVLWQHRIVNAIVLVQGTVGNSSTVRAANTGFPSIITLQVQTWFPYEKGHWRGYTVDTILLDQ